MNTFESSTNERLIHRHVDLTFLTVTFDKIEKISKLRKESIVAQVPAARTADGPGRSAYWRGCILAT